MAVLTRALWSSDTDDWVTPSSLFLPLDYEFHFELDVAASPANAKCRRYFTIEQDGLIQPWAPAVCWMNPPYGKAIPAWVAKAHHEASIGATVVGLLPARTDTAWWHDYIEGKAQVRFLRGRVQFGGVDPNQLEPSTKGRTGAPFPSAIAIWRP